MSRFPAESRGRFKHAPRSEAEVSLVSMKVGPFRLKWRLGVSGGLYLLPSIAVDTTGVSATLFGKITIGALQTTELTRHSPFSFGRVPVFSVILSEDLVVVDGSALLKQAPIVATKGTVNFLHFFGKRHIAGDDWIESTSPPVGR